MTIKTTTLAQATEKLISARETDLTDADLPAISQLRLLAAQIDADSSVASLHSQYSVAYRALMARLDARSQPESTDPLEAELAGALQTR